ncbi:hypothetical protein [Streptomyces sulphureus]|uniref:hypothetical protein n=1 Tax=Streptomyces sulphureus TaxID=47758 RepID=UPI0003611D51|nr:hypothetical protein [Streptomyces sulphureus]
MRRHNGASLAAEAALYGLLGTWFALTVGQQFKKRPRFLERVDPGNVTLPVSTFFAPRPGTTDTHLLVRDELLDGSTTEWAEYPVSQDRSLRQMVWHPNRRREKALCDVQNDLAFLVRQDKGPEHIHMTVPYLALLNFVSHRCPHAPDSRRVQFLLVASGGHDETEEPDVLLASDFHTLDTEGR